MSRGKVFVSEAGGLRFKPWAGQIGHCVANGFKDKKFLGFLR